MKKRGVTTLEIKYDPSNIDKEYLPQPAAKFIPNWFKSIPAKRLMSYLDDNGEAHDVVTVKTCPGIVKILSKGYIVPCPFDIVVEVTGNSYKVTPAFGYDGYVDIHGSPQVNGATGTDFLILKIATPYSAFMDDEVEFVYANPVIHNLAGMHPHQIPTGICEFKQQHSINAFVFVPMHEDKHYIIKAGEPLFQLVPIGNSRINIKYTETLMWKAVRSNILHGVTTWFDRVKYKRRIQND